MKVRYAPLLTVALAACSLGAIDDRYGNQYGGWYDPGSNYSWQLDLCERRVEARGVPAGGRKLAMRCCMYAHGVPIDDAQECRA